MTTLVYSPSLDERVRQELRRLADDPDSPLHELVPIFDWTALVDDPAARERFIRFVLDVDGPGWP